MTQQDRASLATVNAAGRTWQEIISGHLQRMQKDETKGDTAYRCGYNQALADLQKLLTVPTAAPPANF